jgi:hypothetical protein
MECRRCRLIRSKNIIYKIGEILGAFAKPRKDPNTFMTAPLSACISSAPSGRIFVEFYIMDLYETLLTKFQVCLKSDWNIGYYTRRHLSQHTDLCVSTYRPMCLNIQAYVSQHTGVCISTYRPMCLNIQAYVSQHTGLCVSTYRPMYLNIQTYVSQHTGLCVSTYRRMYLNV